MSKHSDRIAGLVGKTISSAMVMKRPEYDDEPYMHLTFTDGTDAWLVASYGGYTGESEDEYPAFIGVMGGAPTSTRWDDLPNTPYELVDVVEPSGVYNPDDVEADVRPVSSPAPDPTSSASSQVDRDM